MPPLNDIAEIQAAQAHLNKILASLQPKSAYGRAIKVMWIAGSQYAEKVSHRDSGALQASHRFEMYVDELGGQVFIDPSATTAKGKKPSEYGPYEEARGGSHAFYERTEVEAGQKIAILGVEELIGAFDAG